MSMKNRFKTRIKKLLLPLATLFLINIPSKYLRKKFAKLVGPYFKGNVAKTIHGFPMITKWHDNMNRISFEGRDTVVENFINNLPDNIMYIDIGANQGCTSILADFVLSKNNGKNVILAFEPSPQSFRLMKKNISLNKCTLIHTFNQAISSTNEKLFLDETNKNNSGASYISSRGNQIICSALNLNKIKKFNSYQNIYIKIDTEGYELFVLNGTKELFEEKLVRKVVIEIDDRHLKRYGNKISDIYNFFHKYNFRPKYGFKNSGHYDEVFFDK